LPSVHPAFKPVYSVVDALESSIQLRSQAAKAVADLFKRSLDPGHALF